MTCTRLLCVGVSLLTLSGCAEYTNLVHREFVRMDASRPTYAADADACRQLAEGPDYLGEMLQRAVLTGVVGGVVGGTAGGVVGNQFGNAALGASVGATSAVLAAVVVSPMQDETATTVWAKCMTSRGHPVFQIRLH